MNRVTFVSALEEGMPIGDYDEALGWFYLTDFSFAWRVERSVFIDDDTVYVPHIDDVLALYELADTVSGDD